MRVAGDRRAAAADQEVEVSTLVGLLDVLDIKLVVAALRRLGRFPGGATTREDLLLQCELMRAYLSWAVGRGGNA